MYRLLLALMMIVFLLPAISRGQLVEVGPHGGVRVNAPFVHVEVGPGGETHVRAPFTSVFAPGRRFMAHPVFGQPLFGPPAYERELPGHRAPVSSTSLSQMSWLHLRQHVRSAASRLDAELARMADGDVWQHYLRPQAVLQLVANDVDRAPLPSEAAQSKNLLRVFDATASNRQLAHIMDLPGFHDVRAGLRQLSAASADRQDDLVEPVALRGQLAQSAMRLDGELRRFASSPALRNYLELPVEVYARDGTTDSTIAEMNDPAAFELVLGRYDRVHRSPKYRDVASLESFRTTRRLLSDYVASLQNVAPAPTIQLLREQEPTPAEPLPPPQPLPRLAQPAE
jgi:hypothetical protein